MNERERVRVRERESESERERAVYHTSQTILRHDSQDEGVSGRRSEAEVHGNNSRKIMKKEARHLWVNISHSCYPPCKGYRANLHSRLALFIYLTTIDANIFLLLSWKDAASCLAHR